MKLSNYSYWYIHIVRQKWPNHFEHVCSFICIQAQGFWGTWPFWWGWSWVCPSSQYQCTPVIQAWGEVGVWLCSVFKVLNQCGEYFHYFETKLSIPIKPLHQSQLEGCSHFEPLDVGRFQIYGHMLFLYGFHTQSASSSSSNRGRCDACITKSSQKVVYACMCVCMYA